MGFKDSMTVDVQQLDQLLLKFSISNLSFFFGEC